MGDLIGLDVLLLYLSSMILIGSLFYFSLNKKTRPFNFIDSMWYVIFIITNFASVIIVLFYSGYISNFYMITYSASFISLFYGVFLGARIKISVKPLFVERTIFTPKYFYLMLLLGLLASIFGLVSNAETWMMDGDAHLNRLLTAHKNAAYFYLSWATSNVVTIYLMISTLMCKSKWQKIQAYCVILLTVLAAVTGAARSGIMGQLFQLSLVLFILMEQKTVAFSLKKFKLLIFAFIIIFVGGVIFITLTKDEDRSGWYSIIERLVFSADALIYMHVFLKESFEYKLDSSLYYLLHPILKQLGLSVIEGGIGPSMSAALSGEMTGRGPVSTFIYDGMFLFGYFGMLIYAFFVGIFLSGTRNLVVNLVRSKLLFRDFFYFFSSIFLFFMSGVIINDLLTFTTLLIVFAPILCFIIFFTQLYKYLVIGKNYAANQT